MKNKVAFITVFTIIALSVVISIAFFLPRKSPLRLPKQFEGNWINKISNQWPYGLFEEFVVYENDFWQYKQIKTFANGTVILVISKQDKTVELHLKKVNNKQLLIAGPDGKMANCILMGNIYPDYHIPDHTPFAKPSFTIDSVTIIGYYKNLDVGIKGFVQRFFRSPFEVTVADFISGEDVKYYGAIESDGKFKVTFPVMNSQELYLDWKRTRIRAVVEPKDTLFLFADIADYVPTSAEKSDYGAYINRPKQVLFMGRHARLNNELR